MEETPEKNNSENTYAKKITPSPAAKEGNISPVSEALSVGADNIRFDRVFHDRVADVRTNLVLDLGDKYSRRAWMSLQDPNSFAINFLWDACKAEMSLEKSTEALLEMFKGDE